MRSNPLAGELLGSPALLAFPHGCFLAPTLFNASDQPEDEDNGDLSPGVDEDQLDDDELDTVQITDPDASA